MPTDPTTSGTPPRPVFPVDPPGNACYTTHYADGSTWHAVSTADGQLIYSDPTPVPRAPDADGPPDEPHVVG